MLKGKNIVLGITGSIAAYKTPELVRQFVKAGANVQVIATPSALDFVTELALSTVSNNKVLISFSENGEWNKHVKLGVEADIIIIAPASANTIAKMANGLCDNMLTAVYLSAKCPIMIAPAMDLDMMIHPATVNNIELLRKRGNIIIEAEYGFLASGLEGKGRMAEPQHIVTFVEAYFQQKNYKPLSGKKVLVTAGPTYEKLDPVRYIGNYSSGKMGIAIADYFCELGADVSLVLGPSHYLPSNKAVQVFKVESAKEMYQQCINIFPKVDIAVMAAAVADYAPKNRALQKIKKENGDDLTLELVKNQDILASLGAQKNEHQILVGFALETENEVENALTKLHKKNADFIVLNSLNTPGAGFDKDTNEVIILGADNSKTVLNLAQKTEIAEKLVLYILDKSNKYATVS